MKLVTVSLFYVVINKLGDLIRKFGCNNTPVAANISPVRNRVSAVKVAMGMGLKLFFITFQAGDLIEK